MFDFSTFSNPEAQLNFRLSASVFVAAAEWRRRAKTSTYKQLHVTALRLL